MRQLNDSEREKRYQEILNGYERSAWSFALDALIDDAMRLPNLDALDRSIGDRMTKAFGEGGDA